MTADRRAALVERVALAFCGKDAPCVMCRNDAKRALDIIRAEVLEEAARVADYDNSLNGDFIAASIRALKENHNDTE